MKVRDIIERSTPLIDLDVSRNGDGRTVTAYAATFDQPYEISDQYGHYDETIHRAAFNRAIKAGIQRVGVLFNHGLTSFGTPSDKWSAPVGTPVEVRAEPKGLLTVTRYANTPNGDEALQLIIDGAVRFMSFRGAAVRSGPTRQGPNGRPVIERLELGLREYGPTQFPGNPNAAVVAVRSQIAEMIQEMDLDQEERLQLIDLLKAGTPLDAVPHGRPTTHEVQPAAPETPAAPDPGPVLNQMERALAALRKRHESS